jgi:hypothetical protein
VSAPEPKEIREAYKDFRNDWQEIRDEASADMAAISVEGPWSMEDRNDREAKGRPCVHLDLINQYLNQTKGNVRKSKRAVQLIPKGQGANDQDAKIRSGIVMGIEERSQAQPIYLNAFECMIERSYGFAVIRTEYKDDSSFDQDIIIKPVMNPDTVLLSLLYKQPDASDVPEAFLLDLMTRSKFKKDYPDAKITDFASEVMGEQGVADWITDKNVQVAEYWRVEHETKTLLLVETGKGTVILLKDEWEAAGKHGEVKRDRKISIPKVMQYMTNGVEVLDEIPWAGSRIPIISCLGPERWRTLGGKARRELLSMVRFARDPQMLYDFLATQETELAGMVPKTPYVGYKGQFESDKEVWQEITKVPHAFVQADVVIDGSNGQILPPPQRGDWSPDFQQYELAKDSAGRSLQSSMGISPLPTAAQRRNEKSGVALEKIDDMESIGSINFVDRYENGFLHNMGWQLNELIKPILDTQREMPVSHPDGSHKVLSLIGNTSHPIDDSGAYEVQGLPEDHFHTGKGEFDVTISTGPSYQSEREEQSEFVNQLIENLQSIPMPGTPAAVILGLAIKMRPDLGPIGEQIADVLSPPDPNNLPPQAQAIVAQLQGQMQLLTQENSQLKMEKAAKQMEQQGKMEIEQIRGQHKLDAKTMDFITQVIKAELAAKSKATDQQAQVDADHELAVLGFHQDHMHNAHEFAMQQDQQGHESEMADKQAQVAAAQQASQISADQQAQQAQQNQPGAGS